MTDASDNKEPESDPPKSKARRILRSVDNVVGFVLTYIVTLMAFCFALAITCNAAGIQQDVDEAMSALPLPQPVTMTLFALPILLVPGFLAWWQMFGKRSKKEG